MTIKYVLAVALVMPLLMVSSIAQTVDRHTYQGGPKTNIRAGLANSDSSLSGFSA
ncbi:hypothetical protein JOE50_002758 [Bradyrhizobium japonicum]|nr:hypothetical protein [Bradyrhizobium japonicum]